MSKTWTFINIASASFYVMIFELKNPSKRHIQKHPDHTTRFFFKKTISAQLHLFAALLAFIGFIFLLYFSWNHKDSWNFWACLVFGLTGVLMFMSSSIYHFLSDGFMLSPKMEKMLNDFDHFSIYLFIAGSYTPFLVNVVQPPWKSILLFFVWFFAIFGILYSYFKPRLSLWAQHRFIYTGIFVAMGWTMAVRLNEIYDSLTRLNFGLLLSGGLAYTIGAVIYAFEKPLKPNRFFGFHEVWHIMVMIGFALHYFLILGFYI